MYVLISGRIKAFDFAFLPISFKVMKKTRIENSNIIDDSQIEEIWGNVKIGVAILSRGGGSTERTYIFFENLGLTIFKGINCIYNIRNSIRG